MDEPSTSTGIKRPTSFLDAYSDLTKSELYKQAAADLPARPTPKTNSIVVNARQRGNPVLKHVRRVPWEFGEVVPDYEMGHTTCALFLSICYHNLKPDYVHQRIKELGKLYLLRVLLVQVDVKDPHKPLKDLTKICLRSDLTLMLAWSAEEAAGIIETYKLYERKPPDMIMEKKDANPYQRLIDVLTSIRSVNKTDAMTLFSVFGTFDKILQASGEDLSLCPGIGPQKAARIYHVLHSNFLKSAAKS